MSSSLGSPTGDATTGDQQPPSPLEPSAPEVLPPPPELPPSPPPELSASPRQPQPTQPLAQITQPPPQSTEPQAQPQQPADPWHQTAVTGFSPEPAPTISAPPAYSEVIKNQPQQPVQYLPQQGAYPVQHVHQPGHPQYMYAQQPGVQPAIQTTPYMVQTPFQAVAIPRPNYPGPHDFFILSVISTTILALLNITSLVFGIPVMIFSGQSKDHKYRGDYPGAKKYANMALSLMIVNIIYVLGGAVFAIGMSLGLHYQFLYS